MIGSCASTCCSRARHAAARISSRLPHAGSVVVETKRALELHVPHPAVVRTDSPLAVTVNGHAAGVTLAEDEYLTMGSLAAGSRVEVTFAQPAFVTQERALGYTQALSRAVDRQHSGRDVGGRGDRYRSIHPWTPPSDGCQRRH